MIKTVSSPFTGKLLTLLMVFLGLGIINNAANAQTVLYNEGGDLANATPGTTLTISSAGTYTVSGTVTSGTDPQDWHSLVISSGLQLTNATYTIGAGYRCRR